MSSIPYTHHFISSLVFTIVLETIIVFLLLRYVFKNTKVSTGRMIFGGLFASFATIPYVWFVFPSLLNWSRATSLWVSEPTVFVLEAIFYRSLFQTDWKTSFILSLVANVASYVLGPILRSHGLWISW